MTCEYTHEQTVCYHWQPGFKQELMCSDLPKTLASSLALASRFIHDFRHCCCLILNLRSTCWNVFVSSDIFQCLYIAHQGEMEGQSQALPPLYWLYIPKFVARVQFPVRFTTAKSVDTCDTRLLTAGLYCTLQITGISSSLPCSFSNAFYTLNDTQVLQFFSRVTRCLCSISVIECIYWAVAACFIAELESGLL